MRPRLLVLSGPLKDSTIPLSEGEITIGREASNGIAVTDPSVSRKHCLVSGQDGRFRVRDLDSRNGTLVNGTGVEEQWLQHGDEIAAGDSSFLFLLEEEDLRRLRAGWSSRRRSIPRKPRSSIPGTWFICSPTGCCASCRRPRA